MPDSDSGLLTNKLTVTRFVADGNFVYI